MNTNPAELIESLLVTSNRLIRIAAQGTGSTTPAAVWRTLSILATDGAMRVGDLARASRVSQPTMTKLLQQLADGGFVRRAGDAEDSRASVIEITDEGHAGLDDWRHQIMDQLGPIFADLTPAEMKTLQEAAAILQARTEIAKKVA